MWNDPYAEPRAEIPKERWLPNGPPRSKPPSPCAEARSPAPRGTRLIRSSASVFFRLSWPLRYWMARRSERLRALLAAEAPLEKTKPDRGMRECDGTDRSGSSACAGMLAGSWTPGSHPGRSAPPRGCRPAAHPLRWRQRVRASRATSRLHIDLGPGVHDEAIGRAQRAAAVPAGAGRRRMRAPTLNFLPNKAFELAPLMLTVTESLVGAVTRPFTSTVGAGSSPRYPAVPRQGENVDVGRDRNPAPVRSERRRRMACRSRPWRSPPPAGPAPRDR